MIKEAYNNVIENNEVMWVFTTEYVVNILVKNPRYILDRPELATDKNAILTALTQTSEEFIEDILALAQPKFYEELKTLFGDHKPEVFIRFFREKAMIDTKMNEISKLSPREVVEHISTLKLDIESMAQSYILDVYGKKYFNTIVTPCNKAIAMCEDK